MKAILITGTDGFIGAYLKSYLTDRGYKVTGTVFLKDPDNDEIWIDITEPHTLEKLPSKSFDAIIHTVGIIDQTAPKELMFRVNAEGTRHLLDWAEKRNCKHFIQLSSIAVYGLKTMGEDRTEEDTKRYLGRLFVPYGRSKARAEVYIENSGINYTILRLPSVLGERDTFISPSIIPRMKTGTFYFFGKKDHLFSTLYIKNLGPILEKTIEAGAFKDVFNCTDYHIRWSEFVQEFADNLGIELRKQRKSVLNILFHLRDKNYLYMLVNSYFGAHFPNEKLRNAINFEPKYPWQDGVKEAIKGFLEKSSSYT